MLIWIAVAWAQPQDLTVQNLLAEVEIRNGETEGGLRAKVQHARALAQTPDLSPDHQARAEALACEYALRYALAFGGFGSCGRPLHELRDEIQEPLEPRYSDYRTALEHAYAFRLDEALAVLPPNHPRHRNRATTQAVLDEAIAGLRAHLQWASGQQRPGCAHPMPLLDRERQAFDALTPEEQQVVLADLEATLRANAGKIGLGGRGMTRDEQIAAENRAASVRSQLILLSDDARVPGWVSQAEYSGKRRLGQLTEPVWILHAGRAVHAAGRPADAIDYYQRASTYGADTRAEALSLQADALAALGQDAAACLSRALAGEGP
ncbi:MAG: hypothetical protein P8R54_08985 [Myxococcota bacterium]|nr:hypothetical protein [Myxococcota bacterium]